MMLQSLGDRNGSFFKRVFFKTGVNDEAKIVITYVSLFDVTVL
jgi:hypothetical protein